MKFLSFFTFSISAAFLVSCGTSETKFPKSACYKWEVAAPKFDFAKYVDPMIGTGGHGHTFPGATAPFGMVQLSPDTRVDGSWDGCSGYHYSDSIIYGFSHTHLSGTGCSDYGDILFMPGKGEKQNDTNQFRSTFSHTNEKAEAGYYSVVLDRSQTKVELTASPRVGMHRYTFSSDDENSILLDLVHRDEVIDSHVEIINDHAIQGYRFSKAWASNQRVYFYAEFSRDFSSRKILTTAEDNQERKEMGGKNVKVVFSFSNGKTEPVILKVALSAVSCENAKQNMAEEVPDFDFDAVHKKVVDQWNDELGKIEVKTSDETKKKIFYTALYHCFIAPNLYCDVNGDYRGRDDSIHCDTIHPQYTVFSLWDTYRALNPLFTIVQQKRTNDFISTFVKQAQEGGMLPVWELSANETNCMIGYHSVPVIVDAWMKGITDFDTATAYEAMKNSAMQDTRGLEAYKKFGFIPAEGESESVSKTLEYAFDDWCIAQAAKRMKNDSDYQYFMRRSQSWKNLFDPKTGFFRPRLNNSFVEPFDPNEVNFHFTEANAWQYSLAVQQDIPGLINEFNSQAENDEIFNSLLTQQRYNSQNFLRHLDSLFSTSSKTSGRDQSDISGMIGQYAQGNEPSHHMAYLYDYTSEPWKTQKLVSEICNELYTAKPDGLCGNEDCGQMSAWYVLSAIGFYQVTPCSNEFQIGSPQFDEVIFHFENGKEFIIGAKNVSPMNPYFAWSEYEKDRVGLKGFSFQSLMNGGARSFEMGNEPVIDTAQQIRLGRFIPKDFPDIPIAPIITNISGRTFTKELRIELASNPGTIIHYQLNNEQPKKYSLPIIIHEHSILKSWATPMVETNEMLGIVPMPPSSDTSYAEFFKSPDYKSITIANAFAPQYSAGGNRALIDGIRGADNFRTGDWQGYEGKDLDAVIDLGSEKHIYNIVINFLQDEESWIFMPDSVTFYISNDGKNFTMLGSDKNSVDPKSKGPHLNTFSANPFISANTKARYIKVVAKNIGTCPSWHPGHGNPAWIFTDEINILTEEK